MSRALLDAITALDGTERLIAFAGGLRVGYAHLGDQWITFEETPQGGRNQYFHPDAFAAYTYICARGLGEAVFRLIEP
jgi:hypothetical protein